MKIPKGQPKDVSGRTYSVQYMYIGEKNNDLQNTAQKTKDRAKRSQVNTGIPLINIIIVMQHFSENSKTAPECPQGM